MIPSCCYFTLNSITRVFNWTTISTIFELFLYLGANINELCQKLLLHPQYSSYLAPVTICYFQTQEMVRRNEIWLQRPMDNLYKLVSRLQKIDLKGVKKCRNFWRIVQSSKKTALKNKSFWVLLRHLRSTSNSRTSFQITFLFIIKLLTYPVQQPFRKNVLFETVFGFQMNCRFGVWCISFLIISLEK